MNNSRILLLGYGEMGHAMETLLAPHHHVDIWQRHAAAGVTVADLEAAATTADAVFFCVPAMPVANLAEKIGAALGVDALCITIAKGVDARGRTAMTALADTLGPDRHYCALYGPMISEEIRAGRPAFAQVGTPAVADFRRVRDLFAGTSLYLEHNPDVFAVSWAAVLKNVYALLFGVADGLGMGDNTRGFLAVACTREMAAIIAALHGDATVTRGLAGLGDLITTATSAGSHHHTLGLKLAAGDTKDISGEGVHTLQTLQQQGQIALSHYPLAQCMAHILQSPADAATLLQRAIDDVFAPD